MIVPSLPFLGFAAIAALVFNMGSALAWRQCVLLVVNVVFLASFSHDPVAFLPFAGFLALGYAAQAITREGSKPTLFVVLLVVTLAAFFWLKRYTFIPNSAFLPFPYVLVGLSYVFFRVLHLIIDSHQGAVEGRVGLLSYVNYTLNFTSLTSGPIQRYQDYRRMEVHRMPLDLVIAGGAIERIIVGYCKVAIVSMMLSAWQHQAIDTLSADAALTDRAWSGIQICAIYPVYLFFNFSGYVDVVIGVARFFRIELPENFDRPFSAENFINFWGRWHMTLSGWLKTYVYNPLMMTMMGRVTAPVWSPYLAVVAFFVTFFLVGLWHGQTSEFLFFGFLQGGGVAANKLYQVLMTQRLGRKGYRALAANPLYAACSRGLTFLWFAFSLFWFWSNWAQLDLFANRLGVVASLLAAVGILVGATVILAAMQAVRGIALRPQWRVDLGTLTPLIRSRYVRTAWATALVVVTAAIVLLLDAPAPDIVYKTF